MFSCALIAKKLGCCQKWKYATITKNVLLATAVLVNFKAFFFARIKLNPLSILTSISKHMSEPHSRGSGFRSSHWNLSRSGSVSSASSHQSKVSFVSTHHSHKRVRLSSGYKSSDDEINDETINASNDAKAHAFADSLASQLKLGSKQAAELHKLIGVRQSS